MKTLLSPSSIMLVLRALVYRMALLVIFSLLPAAIASPQPVRAQAPLCYVDDSAAGANTGASWTDAYTELQSAINNAACSEIWSAAGTYTPGAARGDSFWLRSGLALYGGFAATETGRAQRDPALNVTILSGNNNNYHVVRSGSVDATAVLDGFTISAGKADGSSPDDNGGGMFIDNGSPALANITFSSNSADFGGGMLIQDGSAALTNVTFSSNSADYGGGMYNFHGSPALANVTFSSNSANVGGGMCNNSGSLSLANVTFSGNSATRGGGMYNYASASLANVTFSGNSATIGGGGMYNAGDSPALANSILWNNGTSGFFREGGTPTLTDSIVQGGCPGGANCTNVFDIDPQLSPLQNNGGYTKTMALGADSFAVENGGLHSTCAATDQRGVARPQGPRCDIGAYEFRHTAAPGNAPLVSSPSVPGLGALLEGQQLAGGLSRLMLTFNQDMLHDGSAGAADNPANYLLVRAGGNGVQTAGCLAGVSGGDSAVTIDSAAYDNHGGAGPFEATLSFNGGAALPDGIYRLFVCGTTSITNTLGEKLYAGLTDYGLVFSIGQSGGAGGSGTGGSGTGGSGTGGSGTGGSGTGDGGTGDGDTAKSGAQLPATGFAPAQVTLLPPQSIPYTDLGDFWLEVPRLAVKMPIVGVPKNGDGWDVSWLGSNAGWLEGSAYPSWNGNSVITGHVWNADNSAGAFVYLNTLCWGDQVIVHAAGKQFIYEVRSVKEVAPGAIDEMMMHQDLPWLTLVSCKGYVESTGEYRWRVLVRAVLVDVKSQ